MSNSANVHLGGSLLASRNKHHLPALILTGKPFKQFNLNSVFSTAGLALQQNSYINQMSLWSTPLTAVLHCNIAISGFYILRLTFPVFWKPTIVSQRNWQTCLTLELHFIWKLQSKIERSFWIVVFSGFSFWHFESITSVTYQKLKSLFLSKVFRSIKTKTFSKR